MGLLQRHQVKPWVLPRQQVEVEELGGTVEVAGMTCSQRMEFMAAARRVSQGREVDPVLIMSLCVPVLADSVLAADGQPLMSLDRWEAFGASDAGAAAVRRLAEVLLRLSGLAPAASQDGEDPTRKNS